MGNYITQNDLQRAGLDPQKMTQLTDDDRTGAPNETTLNSVIDSSESLVNSYLEARYIVPVVNPPESLKTLTADLTIYRLYLRHESVPESRQTAYDQAIMHLKEIQAGKADLGVATPPPAAANASRAEFSTQPRVFTRDTVRGW